MEALISLKSCQKQSHSMFDFFINKIEEENSKTYIEEFLGLPQLPLIGHYNGSDYSLGSVLSLICFQIKICQGDKNDEIISPFSDFNLPKNIEEYLCINAELEISNNTKNKKLESIFHPKKKLNFYFIISSLPYVINSNKNIYNIVPHLYYNKNNTVDFSNTKRLVFEKAISLFDIEKSKEKNDIDYFDKDKLSISINDLRIEYSSLHLKKGSLAFSPNNLKFVLDNTKPLSQFYLIMNDKDNEYHSVFYYICCNTDKDEVNMKNLLKKSNTIKDLIDNIKNEFPDSKDIIDNLNKIFIE
jgi:hypothetical protein